jgi:hypothetical protein
LESLDRAADRSSFDSSVAKNLFGVGVATKRRIAVVTRGMVENSS